MEMEIGVESPRSFRKSPMSPPVDHSGDDDDDDEFIYRCSWL